MVRWPDGRIAVDEVWIAFDAGTIVNPDRVRAQMEGAVIYAMSLTLFQGITFAEGAVEQSNFLDGGLRSKADEAPARHGGERIVGRCMEMEVIQTGNLGHFHPIRLEQAANALGFHFGEQARAVSWVKQGGVDLGVGHGEFRTA